jgi:hypothetical protein
MRHTSLISAALAALLCAGCTLNSAPELADFPTAFGPEGVSLRVSVPDAEYSGELLETRPDAFLILTTARSWKVSGETRQATEAVVRLLSHSRIEAIRSARGSGKGVPKWVPGDPKSRERFRMVSRFPQGLSPELLQQLLKMYGQTQVAGGRP